MSASATPSRPAIRHFLLGGLIAGGVSALLSMVYSFAYTAATGQGVPEILNPVSITLSCVVTSLIGGLLYFGFSRWIPARATLVFQIVAAAVAVLSLASSFPGQLPNGQPAPDFFPALSAPMHLIAGAVAAVLLPAYVTRRSA
ncbi:MAG: DUF6069 family protein [Bacteroidia bacterium]|nr:DUF6069 family protein [Bacteroidia bacterium]